MVRPLVRSESVGRTLPDFLRAPRYEVLPTDDVLDLVTAYVPKDVTITVTASPRRGMSFSSLLSR